MAIAMLSGIFWTQECDSFEKIFDIFNTNSLAIL
jgi:hypothetical protein